MNLMGLFGSLAEDPWTPDSAPPSPGHCCLRKSAAPVWIHWLGFGPHGRQMCVTTFSRSALVYRGSQMLSWDPVTAAAAGAEFYERERGRSDLHIDQCSINPSIDQSAFIY